MITPGEPTPATNPAVILIAKTLMLSTRENGIFVGAFRHSKYPPNLVALHTSRQCGLGVFNTGATFGDNTSPSNFQSLADGRRYLAQYLWLNDHSVVDRTIRVLPPIHLADSPSDDVIASFTKADTDSLNLGVFYPNGDR